jgi:hypothetical protein
VNTEEWNQRLNSGQNLGCGDVNDGRDDFVLYGLVFVPSESLTA